MNKFNQNAKKKKKFALLRCLCDVCFFSTLNFDLMHRIDRLLTFQKSYTGAFCYHLPAN